MKEIIFLNGKFLSPGEAKISALGPGLLYGWGLFESMRSYNKKIVYFDAHLKRLERCAKLLHIIRPYPPVKLKEIIRRLLKINGHKDAYIRLTLWKGEKGTDILVTAKKYQPYPSTRYKNGFRASISSFRQNEDSYLAQFKTTNYLFYRLALMQAIENGFDEAIILNQRGYIAESSRSNLFFIKDKELFTPSLKCGCLDGITRQVIFDLARKYNIKVFAGNFSITDLCASDEAFLTNSLMGIMPLFSLERKPIGTEKSKRLTKLLIEKYNCLLRFGSLS